MIGPSGRGRRGSQLSTFLAVTTALMFIAHLPSIPTAAQASLRADRPNILILVSDDQPLSLFTRKLMPSVFSHVVDQGVRFERFYVNSSVCCPSRAEILTGLNEQHTGVDDNGAPLLRPTIVESLDELGYRTVLSGKYLNSHPCAVPRPEFDAWLCQALGPPSGYSLTDPTLNLNGVWTHYTGYTTEIEADYLIDAIDAGGQGEPFFAMFTPPSPHLPANDDRYASMPVPWTHPPSFDENTGDKPFYMRRGPLTSGEITRADARHATMARAVRALDDSIGRILEAIASSQRETLVFFLSDNGFLLGEHRRWAKMVPYEESVHMPLAVRFPAMVPQTAAFRSPALTSNIDIAPTIADVLDIPWGADGRSLVPLLEQKVQTVHDAVLINWCEGVHTCAGNKLSHAFLEPELSIPSYFGAVTDRYKYVEYRTGERELYDLRSDPDELTNRAGDPRWASVQDGMAATLAGLTDLPRPATTIVTGPRGPEDARAFLVRYFTQSRFGSYECRLSRNGVIGAWSECDGQQARIGPLRDGDYIFVVRGTDERGRTDATPATRSFSVQTLGPAVTITDGPAVHLRSRTVDFRFSSAAASSLQCRVGLWPASTSWSPCYGGSAVVGPLADGVWAFEVRGLSGDMATTPPALWLFQVDNVGPRMVFDAKPAATTTSRSAYFRFRPNEPTVGTVECSLDGGAAVDCGRLWFKATGLTAGTHEFAVKARDELGIVGSTSYTWTVRS